MFKRVENDLELAMFNGVWTTVWMEKGFDLEFSQDVLGQFLVVTDEGHYVGTSEVKTYRQDGSPLNEVAPFHLHPDIAAAPGRVAEVDKMALLKPYRGEYASDVLSSVICYAEEQGIRFYVALMEPVFLRALRITYKVPYEKLGDKQYYKGDYIIPVLLKVEEIYRSKEQFSWLISPQTTA